MNQLPLDVVTKLVCDADVSVGAHLGMTCKAFQCVFLQAYRVYSIGGEKKFQIGHYTGHYKDDSQSIIFDNDCAPWSSIRVERVDYKIDIEIDIEGGSHSYFVYVYIRDVVSKNETKIVTPCGKTLEFLFGLKQYNLRLVIKIPTFERFNVKRTYWKRDRCNIVGVTLCYHSFNEHASVKCSHRLGIDVTTMQDNIFDFDKILRLSWSSNISLCPLFGMPDSSNPWHHFNVDFIISSTNCVATIRQVEHGDWINLHKYIEYFVNAIRSTFEEVDYSETKARVIEEVSEKMAHWGRCPSKLHLDIPNTIDELWELLCNVEIVICDIKKK